MFDEKMVLSAFEKVFGEDYPQNDNFYDAEIFEKIYGNGKLPKVDLVFHIDNELKPIGVSLKQTKENWRYPLTRYRLLLLKMMS